MRKHSFFSIFVIISCQVPSWIMGQDNQYQTIQLGAKNSILSGASISRWVDETAVFNNPATLTRSTSSGILFNTAAASLSNIEFRNGLGTDNNIKSSYFRVLPGLVAGEYRSKKSEKNFVLGYAIYHRTLDKLRFTSRYTGSVDLIPEDPGPETYVGQYHLDSDYDETALAFGTGLKLNENLSIGFTPEFLFRRHKYREQYSASLVADPSTNPAVDVVSSNSDISLYYSKIMAHLKIGLAWHNGPWDIGLVLTTPTIGIYGNGDLSADISLENIRTDSTRPRRSYLANTFIPKMKPTYKYPLEISLGVSRSISNVHLSGALTWYASQDRYLILDPGNTAFLQPPSDSNILYTPKFLEVWASNRSVLNGSVSADWALKKDFHLLFAYRTDNHFAQFLDGVPGFQLSKKIWNLSHFTAGTQIIGERSIWIFGFQYTRGSDDHYRQPYSFDGVTEGNFLRGDKGYGEIKMSAFSLLVSFSFRFGGNNKE